MNNYSCSYRCNVLVLCSPPDSVVKQVFDVLQQTILERLFSWSWHNCYTLWTSLAQFGTRDLLTE